MPIETRTTSGGESLLSGTEGNIRAIIAKVYLEKEFAGFLEVTLGEEGTEGLYGKGRISDYGSS